MNKVKKGKVKMSRNEFVRKYYNATGSLKSTVNMDEMQRDKKEIDQNECEKK